MDNTAGIRAEIERLRLELNEHNHNYYVLNAPTISDREFDEMMHRLENLERQYPQYDDPLSPTHRVGSDLTRGFAQVAHIYPMLSLANTYSVEEVDTWGTRIRRDLARYPFLQSGRRRAFARIAQKIPRALLHLTKRGGILRGLTKASNI